MSDTRAAKRRRAKGDAKETKKLGHHLREHAGFVIESNYTRTLVRFKDCLHVVGFRVDTGEEVIGIDPVTEGAEPDAEVQGLCYDCYVLTPEGKADVISMGEEKHDESES